MPRDYDNLPSKDRTPKSNKSAASEESKQVASLLTTQEKAPDIVVSYDSEDDIPPDRASRSAASAAASKREAAAAAAAQEQILREKARLEAEYKSRIEAEYKNRIKEAEVEAAALRQLIKDAELTAQQAKEEAANKINQEKALALKIKEEAKNKISQEKTLALKIKEEAEKNNRAQKAMSTSTANAMSTSTASVVAEAICVNNNEADARVEVRPAAEVRVPPKVLTKAELEEMEFEAAREQARMAEEAREKDLLKHGAKRQAIVPPPVVVKDTPVKTKPSPQWEVVSSRQIIESKNVIKKFESNEPDEPAAEAPERVYYPVSHDAGAVLTPVIQLEEVGAVPVAEAYAANVSANGANNTARNVAAPVSSASGGPSGVVAPVAMSGVASAPVGQTSGVATPVAMSGVASTSGMVSPVATASTLGVASSASVTPTRVQYRLRGKAKPRKLRKRPVRRNVKKRRIVARNAARRQ
jgi:hypothetical protein